MHIASIVMHIAIIVMHIASIVMHIQKISTKMASRRKKITFQYKEKISLILFKLLCSQEVKFS
jgi:hypothetical protein